MCVLAMQLQLTAVCVWVQEFLIPRFWSPLTLHCVFLFWRLWRRLHSQLRRADFKTSL